MEGTSFHFLAVNCTDPKTVNVVQKLEINGLLVQSVPEFASDVRYEETILTQHVIGEDRTVLNRGNDFLNKTDNKSINTAIDNFCKAEINNTAKDFADCLISGCKDTKVSNIINNTAKDLANCSTGLLSGQGCKDTKVSSVINNISNALDSCSITENFSNSDNKGCLRSTTQDILQNTSKSLSAKRLKTDIYLSLYSPKP